MYVGWVKKRSDVPIKLEAAFDGYAALYPSYGPLPWDSYHLYLTQNTGINTMNKFSTALLLTALLFNPFMQAAQADTAADSYKIQPGDVLEVSVWREENLIKQVLVRPDGGISFPLAGDIHAAGESVAALEQQITQKLNRYIPDPIVTVSMQQLSGNKIYVVGKVARPGEYVATSYVDVVQAIAMAGGMTTFASVNKIKIVRRMGEKLEAYSFRFSDIEDGENLEQNIILSSGDIVIVP
jgi:polysaccharide export outer membrane protein